MINLNYRFDKLPGKKKALLGYVEKGGLGKAQSA